jgi:hypothetical protein
MAEDWSEIVVGLICIGFVGAGVVRLMDPTLTTQASQQYVIVDNTDGVRNVDTFFPHQSRCIVWGQATLRSHKIDDTFVREVVSNSSTHGSSCPEGTQYHETERW